MTSVALGLPVDFGSRLVRVDVRAPNSKLDGFRSFTGYQQADLSETNRAFDPVLLPVAVNSDEALLIIIN